MPAHPPPADVAWLLCETFQCEVQHLERRLLSAKQAARTCAHRSDPNLIYKDTRRPVPEPVTSLLCTRKAQIIECEPDTCSVVVDPPTEFDPMKPVCVGTKPVGIVHVADDAVYLTDLPDVAIGSTITQTDPVGTLDEVFAAFHDQWHQRWCKHDCIPHSRWQQLVDFARVALPQHPLHALQVTPDLLRAEAARKKSQAATGLDGVSRSDLLQADPTTLSSLCSAYARACDDGHWPQQVIMGRVASLAKVEQPEKTSDYRPITIFSLIYRCFSSIHARALLDWANNWCHPDIFGNRRGHQTTMLWRTLVDSIQQAYDQGTHASGLTADIEKCFNTLPRWPILAAAAHTGVPQSLLQAWAGALAGMTRRFKVRDSYSEGFTTSTGLAEGCALSCFGMLLLDDIMHRYIHAQQPAVRALSFVDNWDFLTFSADAAVQQLDLLLQFAHLADLTVDRRKTYAWSTCPQMRSQFRQMGLPVKHFAKDLGAHVAVSRQRTNRSVTDRLEALQPFWQQLRASRAGYQTKLRALRTVAWPRGLFAVESAPIASGTWTTQRRQALKSLQFDKPGVNPLLLLGLVESYVDPEFLAAIKTVAETRVQCPLDFWASELFPVAVGIVDPPPSAPVSVLLARIQSLGFTVLPDGSWSDQIGTFHPAHVNCTELCHRMQWQWQRVVAHALGHRKDFGGLPMVDTALTRQKLRALPVDQQALMRLSLAGGLFTQDAHSHWNKGEGVCQWCSAKDSLQHRYFECPQTRDLRDTLAPLVVAHRATIPDAMALRSWAIQPPTHWTWLATLNSVPSCVRNLWTSFRVGVVNHVFTDGSCFWQHDPSVRVASWAAVLASPPTSQWNFTCLGVLGTGWLPGLCQTAYRSELFAVAFVLHHAAAGCFQIKIHSDCLGVINRYHLLTGGHVALKLNSPNGDLWRWILDSVEKLGPSNVEMVKTPAHKRVALAKTRYEAWKFWHNNVVDQVARFTNANRPKQFWDQWQLHAQQVAAVRELYDQVWDLHLAVAQRSVVTEEVKLLDERAEQAPKQTREFTQCFRPQPWDGTLPMNLTKEYGHGLSWRLAKWWHVRTTTTNVGEVRWVTLAHLYVDYQFSWGCPGPVKHGKQWLDATLRPFLDPEKHSFLLRLKWFKRALKFFWKQTKQCIALAQCRGEGEAIQSFVKCGLSQVGQRSLAGR